MESVRQVFLKFSVSDLSEHQLRELLVNLGMSMEDVALLVATVGKLSNNGIIINVDDLCRFLAPNNVTLSTMGFGDAEETESLLQEKKALLEAEFDLLKKERFEIDGSLHAVCITERLLAVGEEPPSAIQILREDIEDLQEQMNNFRADMEDSIEEVNIMLGGEPHVHSGWDNSSTGFEWNIHVADESVVKVVEVRGRNKDTRGLCGGGCDLDIEFYGVSLGSSLVKIHHGRRWDPDSIRRSCYRLKVVEPGDGQLQEILSTLQARHDKVLSELLQRRPNAACSAEAVNSNSPGLHIFTLRQAIQSMQADLKTFEQEDALQVAINELEARELTVANEEKALEHQSEEVTSQIDAVIESLEKATGSKVLRQMQGGCMRCDFEVLDEDPIDRRKRLLKSREDGLVELRIDVQRLKEELERYTEQLRQAQA